MDGPGRCGAALLGEGEDGGVSVEPTGAVQKAKDTLLRALDELTEAEQALEAAPDRVDLIVVYSIGREAGQDGAWHEVGGWASTAGPKWMQAAMLRRTAQAFEVDAVAVDSDDEDEDDE